MTAGAGDAAPAAQIAPGIGADTLLAATGTLASDASSQATAT